MFICLFYFQLVQTLLKNKQNFFFCLCAESLFCVHVLFFLLSPACFLLPPVFFFVSCLFSLVSCLFCVHVPFFSLVSCLFSVHVLFFFCFLPFFFFSVWGVSDASATLRLVPDGIPGLVFKFIGCGHIYQKAPFPVRSTVVKLVRA